MVFLIMKQISTPFKLFLMGNKETDTNGFLKEKGLTLLQFAEALGVSRISLHHYMTGSHSPKRSTLNKMEDVLGLNRGDLLKYIQTREVGRPRVQPPNKEAPVNCIPSTYVECVKVVDALLTPDGEVLE